MFKAIYDYDRRYLSEPARQLAISSPSKIRPMKQRFLRETSNPADSIFKVKGTLTMSLTNFSLSVLYFLNQLVGSVGSGQTFSGLCDKVVLLL